MLNMFIMSTVLQEKVLCLENRTNDYFLSVNMVYCCNNISILGFWPSAIPNEHYCNSLGIGTVWGLSLVCCF